MAKWSVKFERMDKSSFTVEVEVTRSSCGSEEDEAVVLATDKAYADGLLVKDTERDWATIYDPVPGEVKQ